MAIAAGLDLLVLAMTLGNVTRIGLAAWYLLDHASSPRPPRAKPRPALRGATRASDGDVAWQAAR